jgi:hypothetical protein
MGVLIKEYEIPFFGKVELIKSTQMGMRGYESSFYGKYYAESTKLGDGFVKNCNSIDELIEKVLGKIKIYLEHKKRSSENIIEIEKDKINDLETNLLNLEKDKDWLKKYQTKNPLQLEYQEVEKQKRNKK